MNKYFYKTVCLWLFTCIWASESRAQHERRPIITYHASLTFQAYGLPLQNISDSFTNQGVRVGADIGLNKKRNLLQAVSIGYQSHKQHESSYYISTHFMYRPLLLERLEPSLGIGIGYMLSVANQKNPFYEQQNGQWHKSQQTKGHWQAPISISLGYRIKTPKVFFTPFVGYDIVPIIHYNTAFIVLPFSTLNLGTRIAFFN